MTEPNSDMPNLDDADDQEREELKPTCEGMADIPGPVEEEN